MPKQAEYQIVWSQQRKGYELQHGPFCYTLTDDTLAFWEGCGETFHVRSSIGQEFTLRKETKQRGDGYWYAYKRIHGRLEKKYIGESKKLTIATLDAVARHFADIASPQKKTIPPPPKPPPTSSTRTPTLVFTKTLESALRIYGFRSIPNKKDLVSRYRELSKQHHPDTGGLHEDMVAVNLAYDYLKKFVS